MSPIFEPNLLLTRFQLVYKIKRCGLCCMFPYRLLGVWLYHHKRDSLDRKPEAGWLGPYVHVSEPRDSSRFHTG
jgi:hypothetical protein